MRIELCGPLGVGKTTLAVNLAHRMGWTLVREPVESHPFLQAFYKDPAHFAFEKNLFFLLDYLHQIKASHGGNYIFDHSAVVHRSYANLNKIEDIERPVYQALDALTEVTSPPDLLVNLVCPAEVIMDRIRKRGRSFESEVTIDYVRALNAEMQKQVEAVSRYMRVLHLDAASYDLDAHPEHNDKIIDIIHEELHGNVSPALRSVG